jgi:hypothetical protein
MADSVLSLLDVQQSLGLSGGGGGSALQGATNGTANTITGTLSIQPNSIASALQTYNITQIPQSSSSSFTVFCIFRLNFNVTSAITSGDNLAYNFSITYGGTTTYLEPQNNNHTLTAGTNTINLQTSAVFNGDYSSLTDVTATVNISYATTGTTPLVFTVLANSYQSGYVLSLKNTA